MALFQDQKTFAPFAPSFEVPSKPAQIIWRTVLKIVNDTERATSSRRRYLENSVRTAADSHESLRILISSQNLLEGFIAKWKERSEKNDKNSEIGSETGENLMNELEVLREIFKKTGIRSNYIDEYRRRPGSADHMDIADYWFHGRATRDAYEEMITGDDAEFDAIPEGIRRGLWRNLGNNTYPPESHDMICGIDANAGINPLGNHILEDAKLLLELNSSFLWTWGDMGRLQFWIESADAEKQDWRKVFLLLRSS